MSKKRYIEIYGPFAELHVSLAILLIGMSLASIIPMVAWPYLPLWSHAMPLFSFLVGLSFAISAWYCFKHRDQDKHWKVKEE